MKRDARIGLAVVLVGGLFLTLLLVQVLGGSRKHSEMACKTDVPVLAEPSYQDWIRPDPRIEGEAPAGNGEHQETADGNRPTPTVQPGAGEAAPAGYVSYTVQAGDTPSSIAQKYLGDRNLYGKILAANPGLNPTQMRPGQKINLPRIANAAAQPVQAPVKQDRAAPVAQAAPTGNTRQHTIQSGDILGRLAHTYYGSSAPGNVKKILEANPGLDPSRLPVGKTIAIPAP